MTTEPRYDGHGSTVSEYLALAANELDDDTVGMWKIVPAGSAFGLLGSALDDFVRRYISVLLHRGAKPVRAEQLPDGKWVWRVQHQFGDAPDAIAAAIIAEWHSIGSPDPEWGWLRFALPKMIDG